MLRKTFAISMISLLALAGAAQATERGTTIGAGVTQFEAHGIDSKGLEITTSNSRIFNNGVVWQTDLDANVHDSDGVSGTNVSVGARLGYNLGDGFTAGVFAGRTLDEDAGVRSLLNQAGLEGKYMNGPYEIEAGLGKGNYEFGTGDKLDVKTAYLGGRYGLDTGKGELGLGGSFNYLEDDAEGVDFSTKSYLAKVDYRLDSNVEIYAGLGRTETSLNGFTSESDIVKIGAEYRFGKGAFWRNSSF